MNTRTLAKLKPGYHQSNSRTDRPVPEYAQELKAWRYVRYTGILSSFCGLAMAAVAIQSNYWLMGKEYNLGIWRTCYFKLQADELQEYCWEKRPYWQNAVIGLMLFAVAFGFLATILVICGLCSRTLHKKIYYYHSAGEIYFTCALGAFASLFIYPIAIDTLDDVAPHTYGWGYGIGWTAALFYMGSAVCMSLDEIIEAVTNSCKCCRSCCCTCCKTCCCKCCCSGNRV